jgi:hypothetical protein
LLPLIFVAILIVGAVYVFLQKDVPPEPPQPGLTEEQIKQQWRKLGFFCELDAENKLWTLTGSRAGLLYFPDLLLGYVADPKNAADREHQHFGPYGTLEVMTWPEAGFGIRSIRGTLTGLARLAELIEAKLATAGPGSTILIREEFAPDSPYSLLLDVRADGFDPASADRERLGPATERKDPADKPKGSADKRPKDSADKPVAGPDKSQKAP